MKKIFCFVALILSISSLASCGNSPVPTPSEQYKITWKNDDGSILKEDIYERKGVMPEYTSGTPTKKSSAQYSYTFSRWEPSLAPVTCDATYTAKYESHIRSYEIEWQDDEGHTLKKETLKYGEMPNYGSTPTKESTAQYEYRFTGWSPSVTTVTGPAIYKATFSSTIRKHAITWKRDDGTTLRTDYVEYDKTPDYGLTPSKSSTDEYDYEFDYWSPSIAKVTGPATYTAHFKSFRRYLITWKNYDDTTLKTERLREGSTPSYSGSTPTKPSTAQYTYSFSGWDPTITTVTSSKTYTAQFSSTVRSYEIIWEDDNGIVLKRETLTYGSHPSYGSTPSKPSTDDYDYEFAGWSPSITEVTGPATYRATYNSFRKYLITWKNYDDATLKEERLRVGKTPSYSGATPTKPNPDEHHESKFIGWSPSITKVTGPATYKATFETVGKKYTITWKMDDGTTLRTDQVEYDKMPDYGKTPTKESTAQYEYTFTSWNPVVTKVTGDAAYVATFSSKIRSYDIKWEDGDGKIIKTDYVKYGDVPSYTGSTPTKTPSAQYTYTFSNWDPSITTVTGPKTYVAQFSKTPREYTVTATSEDESKGTVTGSGTYAYNSSVTITATPKEGYSFEGWYKESLKVESSNPYTFTMPTNNVSYEAKFKANQYTVTATSEDTSKGSVSGSGTYAYNSSVTITATPKESYSFEGWYKDGEKLPSAPASYSFNMPANDLSYEARFIANKYTVKLTPSPSKGGTVNGNGPHAYNSSVTITATPNTGYLFGGWYNGSSQVSTDASYTFKMPANNVSYEARFINENTWYLKSDWWNYCSNGIVGEQATEEDIGKEVNLNVNGLDHKVRLIDIDHDVLSDDTTKKAHCTFEFSNLLSDSSGYSLATLWNTKDGNSSTNYDYPNSDLRKALDGQGTGKLRWYQKGSGKQSEKYTKSVFYMLPSELRNNIKTVKKEVATTSSYNVTNYDARVFALTYREMTTSSSSLAKSEGTTYQYYYNHYVRYDSSKHQIMWHDGATTKNTEIIDLNWHPYNYAGYNGSTDSYGGHYWLTSPDTGTYGSSSAWHVHVDGSLYWSSVYEGAFAVAPAFCI